MLVMYADQGTLILALTEDKDFVTLREGKTLTFQGPTPYLMKNVMVFAGKDKETIVKMVKSTGIPVNEASLKEMPIPERDH